LSQTITSANGPFLLKQVKLPEQSSNFLQTPIANIVIHPKQVFQEIEGFGYTLTGGSAALLHQLPKANRTALLNELFGSLLDNNMTVSFGGILHRDPFQILTQLFQMMDFSQEASVSDLFKWIYICWMLEVTRIVSCLILNSPDSESNEMEEIETKYYLKHGLSADLLKYFEDRFNAKYGFRYHSIEETNHREKCSMAAILSFIDDEKAKYIVAYLVEEYVKYCKEHDY
jgi:hypothetical protein